MNKNLKNMTLVALMAFAFLPFSAYVNGEERDRERDLYEYNLYDQNYDQLRGRGVYENEDRAYPQEQYYRNPHSPDPRQRRYPVQPD